MDQEIDFKLLKVYHYSLEAGFSSTDINSKVVFLYAKEYNIDKLQLFEILKQIKWQVSKDNEDK